MKTKILLLHILITLMLPMRLLGDNISVAITVDNGYAFGFGDVNGINANQFYGGIDNCNAGEVFGGSCYVFQPPDGTVTDTGPELYYLNNVPNFANGYIYIVAWSDDAVYQGAVASFSDNDTGVTVTTSPNSAAPWQVFATGTNITPNCNDDIGPGSGSHGPALSDINNEIAMANLSAGPSGSSVGWVGNSGWVGGSAYAPGSLDNGRLDFSGQFNGNTYPHAVPSCIGSSALWMEYNPEPANATCNPFVWGSTPDYSIPNFLREYLIYRIGPLGPILSSTNTCTNGCLRLVCPNNIVVTSCVPIPVYYSPSATTCCSNGTLSVVCSPVSGSTYNPNTTTPVNCTATDGCSNSCTCSFTVTVVSPALVLNCTNQTIFCSQEVPTNPPSVYDPCCSNVTVTLIGSSTNSSGLCSTQYIYQVWQAEDSCSNSIICTQTVTVLPSVPVCNYTDLTLLCGQAVPTNPPTFYGSCCSNVTVTFMGSWTNSSGLCSTQYIYQAWRAWDHCCNTRVICTQMVTVLPSAPVLNCSNLTILCSQQVPTNPPSVYDPCCSNVTVSLTGSWTLGNGCTQIVYQVWQALDQCCSNSTVCTQIVTVLPSGPVFNCTTNLTIPCGTPVPTNAPSCYDPCCSNVTVDLVSMSRSTQGCTQIISQVWRAFDNCCSISLDCTQTVTVLSNCCPCLTVTNDCVLCGTDGSYSYSFQVRNYMAQPASYIYLAGDDEDDPVFDPAMIYLDPPLAPGQTVTKSVSFTSTNCGLACFCVGLVTTNFDCCCEEHCIALPNCCLPRTYISPSDFTNGVLMNLTNASTSGGLTFPAQITPFPYVNMACSRRGTVVRIDANTGTVLGEYQTGPTSDFPWACCTTSESPYYTNPSRTTVDRYGNLWVANRNVKGGGVNGDTSSGYGTVTRIALVIGGTRCDSDGTPDTNGEYIMNPSYYSGGRYHTFGSLQLIKTSRGLGDILPWFGPEPINGAVSSAEDDCIMNYTVVTNIIGSIPSSDAGIRTIAVDCSNDVWVGATVHENSYGVHQKLSGTNGLPIAGYQFTGPYLAGGYGGLIDGHGVLWSARGANLDLLRVDLNPYQPCPLGCSMGSDLGSANGDYGLSVDPCSGNIWHTAVETNLVWVRNPAGEVISPCLSGCDERNPSLTKTDWAQGVAVDQYNNVWIAHSMHSDTVGHIDAVTGQPVGQGTLGPGVVDLTHDIVHNTYWPPTNGPTGVAIDSNGKVWVSCYASSKAMRIDPSLANGLGAVDLVVDLGTNPPAGPYNYSDKTGFVVIGSSCPSGFWDFIQTACANGQDWGCLRWDVCAGTQIKVEVRAADTRLALGSNAWRVVQNGVHFCNSGVTGLYLEVRASLMRGTNSCAPSTACLKDLTVECCHTPLPWDGGVNPIVSVYGTNAWTTIDWTAAISVSNALPLTTNLPAVVTQPGGLPVAVTWSVNGQVVQTNEIPAGPAPTQVAVPFSYTFPVGSNFVEVTASDGINCPSYLSDHVIIGDVTAPTWGMLGAYSTNGFLGSIPDVIPTLSTNVLSDDWTPFDQISVTQDLTPGMVVSQGVYMIALAATDLAGNTSTNFTPYGVGPVLNITSPDEYSLLLTTIGTPVTVAIASNVTDVVQVNYYLGTNLVATSTNAPWSVTLTNVPPGNYYITAQAVNPQGLTSVSTAVLVSFNEPLLVCATNKTVQCGTAWTFDPPGVFDPCCGSNGTLTVVSTVTNGSCPQFITQTWQVTGCCTDISVTCSQTVTVVATPVLTCGSNKTAVAGSAWSFDLPTVVDACCGSNVTVTVLSTVTNGSSPQVITRTWLATDCCGNTNTCSQAVTLLDPFTAWQQWYFGCTNLALCPQAAPTADPLGKGISNTNQFLLGLNPTNPASVFRIISIARKAQTNTVTWRTSGGDPNGMAAITNVVQGAVGTAKGDYNSTNFSDITAPIAIVPQGDTITNYSDGSGTNQYYRIRLGP
jgi:hypothetical protein